MTMLNHEKQSSGHTMIVRKNSFTHEQTIHALGVGFLENLLESAGFTIRSIKNDPNHHSHILAEFNNKSLLIAVRTARHPDMGTIDSPTLKMLLKESRELGATPHFAGLSLLPVTTDDEEAYGSVDGQNYKVLFNGISAVRESDLLAGNG